MITAKRAVVVPRVLSPECGYAFSLEEMIEPYLDACGVIAVHGPYGSGKTTALRHLAAVFPGRLVPFDHDAMYTHFEDVVPSVLRFIQHGRFTMSG